MAGKKAKLPPKPPGGFRFPWYLAEWLRDSDNMSQAALGRKTDLGKATISDLVNGNQQYTQSHLELIADALNVRPYELLLPPEAAHAIRKLIAGNDELQTLRSSHLLDEPPAVRIWRTK